MRVTASIVDEDPLSQKIFKSYTQYRRNVIAYERVSERAYSDARALVEDGNQW